MQYSPKLKKAMKAIQQIMDEHDIAGSVILHTPGHGEHFLKVDPTYSAAKIHNTAEGTALTFKIKTVEVGKQKAQELAVGTANLFQITTELLLNHLKICSAGSDQLNRAFNAKHNNRGNSSHEAQNN